MSIIESISGKWKKVDKGWEWDRDIIEEQPDSLEKIKTFNTMSVGELKRTELNTIGYVVSPTTKRKHRFKLGKLNGRLYLMALDLTRKESFIPLYIKKDKYTRVSTWENEKQLITALRSNNYSIG